MGRLCLAASLTLGLVLGSGMALADPIGIGTAASTVDKVEGVLEGAPRFINTGSEVYSNELLKTGDKGIARLVFLDRTDLAVGPKSEVKLDKFVYDPDRNSGAVVINITRGAFRFVTGTQDHRNYSIVTPQGTLGVRGTIFEVLVTSERTDVHLIEGAVEVRSLTDQTVVLTPTAINSASVSTTGNISGFNVPAHVTVLPFSVTALGAAGTIETTGSSQLGSTGAANASNQLGSAGTAPVLGSSGLAPAPPPPSDDVSNLTNAVSE
jgi:FecR protein